MGSDGRRKLPLPLDPIRMGGHSSRTDVSHSWPTGNSFVIGGCVSFLAERESEKAGEREFVREFAGVTLDEERPSNG